ncbi:hypothetical protein [Chitinophaga sp. S165]|uniref:hypothetical protein n=1 Tax=Chitinophaga sp. S165 TaxID=2135462 RepID=UPI0011B6D1B8|nr:hypothetical protein [Chitinophaga sp. S165]
MKRRFPYEIPPKCLFSLVGGINAGKTYYLVCLIHELLRPSSANKILLKKMGIINIEMIDPESENLLDLLIKFSKDGGMEATKPDILGFFSLIITMESGKIYELVLFNSSGEKIEDEIIKRKFYTDSHELKGTVSLCFVNPRKDTGLNRILERPNQEVRANFNFAEHFHKVMQKVKDNNQYVDTPTAICISKFDLLLHRRPKDIPPEPFVDATSKSFFRDIKTVSKQLRAFLETHSDTIDPIDLDSKFSNSCYFAVAPFGKDENFYWDFREPKGLLAPFLWALQQSQIINDTHGVH